MSNQENEQDFASMLADYDNWGERPEVGQKVEGTVMTIGGEVIFVDLGGKSEGAVDRTELLDEDGRLTVEVGDSVTGLVSSVDDGGNVTLRVRPGRGEAMRSELRMAWEQRLPVEGLVESQNKGGVDVTVGGMRAFCPVSQLDLRYVEDPGVFVGQRFEFRITKYEESGRGLNLVVSRRVLLQEEADRRAAEVREWLEVDAVIEGTVTSITSYGAFVDLGGLEGLLHVSEISYQRDIDPQEVLTEGQSIEVQVLKIEPPQKAGQTERISLSMRALQKDPWEGVERRFPVGKITAGRVMRLEPYGAFVELSPGLEGLAHISVLGGDGNARHARQLVELGQDLQVRVLDVDPSKRRISLSREVAEQTDEERREIADFKESSSGSAGFGSLGDFFKQGGKES